MAKSLRAIAIAAQKAHAEAVKAGEDPEKIKALKAAADKAGQDYSADYLSREIGRLFS